MGTEKSEFPGNHGITLPGLGFSLNFSGLMWGERKGGKGVSRTLAGRAVGL